MDKEQFYPSTQRPWEEVNQKPFPNNGEIEDDPKVLEAFYREQQGDQTDEQ
ncbi:MAG: hypothetical protein U5L95_00160 [Candidatus Saccharibacteria bacterium]|nr:hypothetical protein [Candidatus Saccharibacteria bacterium]